VHEAPAVATIAAEVAQRSTSLGVFVYIHSR
jgi:hypothetical protein